MNGNVINETYLKKNIELLKLYSNEEKVKITQIFNEIDICLNTYQTANSTKIKTKKTNLMYNVSTINDNRQECVRILNEVIRIYSDVSKKFVSSAKEIIGE